jgi:hypothetical protein
LFYAPDNELIITGYGGYKLADPMDMIEEQYQAEINLLFTREEIEYLERDVKCQA